MTDKSKREQERAKATMALHEKWARARKARWDAWDEFDEAIVEAEKIYARSQASAVRNAAWTMAKISDAEATYNEASAQARKTLNEAIAEIEKD